MTEEPIFLDEYKIDAVSTRKRDKIRYIIICLAMTIFAVDLFGCSECEEQRMSQQEELQEKGHYVRGKWIRDTWICMNPKCRKRNFEEQGHCSGCGMTREDR